eukprot:1504952-Rhodomonas_salina.2
MELEVDRQDVLRVYSFLVRKRKGDEGRGLEGNSTRVLTLSRKKTAKELWRNVRDGRVRKADWLKGVRAVEGVLGFAAAGGEANEGRMENGEREEIDEGEQWGEGGVMKMEEVDRLVEQKEELWRRREAKKKESELKRREDGEGMRQDESGGKWVGMKDSSRAAGEGEIDGIEDVVV